MAAPTLVTCSICNQQVNKRLTYHVGNGKRACTIHEGVEATKEKLQAEVKAAHEKMTEPPKFTSEKWESCYDIPMGPFCWICKKTGIMEHEFFQRLLVHNKIEDLKGNKRNIFAPTQKEIERTREGVGLKDDQIVVTLYPLELNEWFLPTLSKIRRSSADAARIGHFIAACSGCGEKHKLKRQELPQIPLKTMALLGIMMDPVITDMAFKKLAEE